MKIAGNCAHGAVSYLMDMVRLPCPWESLLWIWSWKVSEQATVVAACSLLLAFGKIASPPENSLIPDTRKERYVLFQNVQGVFSTIDFSKINGMKLERFMGKIEQQLPATLRPRFKNYAPIAFEMSQKYQVDPFWVIAVMWVESHFDINAVSSVGARGLMQVMPKTGSYLASKLTATNYGPHREWEYGDFTRPHTNIEMGVFYLSYLVRKFADDRDKHALATIAYNMGPGRLRYLLLRRRGRRIKQRSSYLKKVRLAYFSLLKPFQRNSYGTTASSTPIHQSKNFPTIF